ncbi:MAG: serine/threonine-protein kinase, partial [Pseudomonadota bacterium]
SEPAYFDKERRYRIIDTLGSGNFGIVYRAYDEKWKEEVALKTSHDDSMEQQRWLKEEYRIQIDIVHPILVQPDELRQEEERSYFTMKLIESAKPFDEHFRPESKNNEEDQSARISAICAAAAELADGLQTIHSFDRCHGDIKPANVLIGEGGRVALLDFGLMRSANTSVQKYYEEQQLSGTPSYMPPEQYEDNLVSKASDWYALGLMLFEAISSREAFAGDALDQLIAKQMAAPNLSAVTPKVPNELALTIDAMLSPNPSERPPPCDVVRVLHKFGGDNLRTQADWESNEAFLDDRFIARIEELNTLKRIYTEVPKSVSRFVEVVGPSGIGKSALIQHFLESQNIRDKSLLLEGRCFPNENIPYKAFDTVINELTQCLLNLPAAELQQTLPESGAASLGLIFPEMRRVREIEAAALVSPRVGDPRTIRQQGFNALGEILNNLATAKNVVIWVDDIQWADVDSAALLESLIATSLHSKILYLFSRRPDSEIADPTLLSALEKIPYLNRQVISLTSLERSQSESLVKSIVGEEADSSGLVSHIIEQAGGLPYLLSELAHYAKRDGARIGTATSDASSQSLLAERLSSLSIEDRVLLELVAVATVPLAPTIILEAAETTQRYRIRDLCIMRLLKPVIHGADQSVQIYHDHLREFVVLDMSAETEVKRHASLLEVMERDGRFTNETLLPHAIASKNSNRVRHHALAAAERAAETYAFEQASNFYATVIDTYRDSPVPVETLIAYADALANAGRSTRAAPTYEKAYELLVKGASDNVEQMDGVRRRAGEQYLKSGHFAEGIQILSKFLNEKGITLPSSGRKAFMISVARRLRLYARGFKFKPAEQTGSNSAAVRLDHLWAATTAVSMMDPVTADTLGLLHFLEALKHGNSAHVARSLGYEAAFAALIGRPFLRAKANKLLALNAQLIDEQSAPYEKAFYHLGASTTAFFNSDWRAALDHADLAVEKFRGECHGADYEAAVAVVWALQALGQAGDIQTLNQRLPHEIQQADDRGDLFAANSYRGGFHAIGRIATGQLDTVQADLAKVVETWTPGFYQMHAYHRVFAGVSADLYQGNPHAALNRIDDDWSELKQGLYLTMELPATELRWTRARAIIGVASVTPLNERRSMIGQVRKLIRVIRRATIPAGRPHAALLKAGLCGLENDQLAAVVALREAMTGYRIAEMQIHHHVAKWILSRLLKGEEQELLTADSQKWQRDNEVPDMFSLAQAIAPGCSMLL